MAVQGPGHGERLCELRRAIGEIFDLLRAALLLHPLDPVDRLGCADQHRSRLAGRFRSDIEAIVHAISEVDICVSWLAEHDLVSSRGTSVGMAGWVVISSVSLYLNDDPFQYSGSESSYENLPEKFLCDAYRVSFVERSRERCR